MTLYQKILSAYAMLRDMIGSRAFRSELAVSFDPSVSYTIGRLVVYDGTLYRCTHDHIGAWDAGHFIATTIDEAIASIERQSGITGVKVNGTPLTPTQGIVNVEALTGVKVNGSAVTPSAGVADVQAITGVKVNGVSVSPEEGVADVQTITGVKVNGTSLTPTSGSVDVQAITGVKVNGSSLTPTSGAVDVQAITGVKVNGTSLTPASGAVDVQAITGVKVNGTSLTPSSGSVNVQAITGIQVDGSSITPSSGVANIPVAWKLNALSDGSTLKKNACNIIDVSVYGDYINLYLDAPKTDDECRQFAICIRNHSGTWNGSIIDRQTGTNLIITYYPEWYQNSLDTLINNKVNSAYSQYGSTSALSIRVYEIYRGVFTIMDVY